MKNHPPRRRDATNCDKKRFFPNGSAEGQPTAGPTVGPAAKAKTVVRQSHDMVGRHPSPAGLTIACRPDRLDAMPPTSPRMDSLEPRRLLAFSVTGASTVTGQEYQTADLALALPGGGFVTAGIFGEDTDFGTGAIYQPKGESDAFLAFTKGGKTSVVAIGGASSQDLDTDDDRADFAAEPRRVGDDFPFGVDSRIRGADEYISQMKIGPDGKLYVALLFRRTASLNTANARAPRLVAADEFAGNYADSAILRYDISGPKLAFEKSMQIGGPFNDFIYDFDFDSGGNLIVVGTYERRADFDPSSKTFNLEPDGRGDGFIAKYSKDFGLIWVDRFGGDTGDDTVPDAVYSVAVAGDDSIYAGGTFAREADFDPRSGKTRVTAIRSEGKTDAFTIKLKSNGTLNWVRVQASDGFDGAKRVTLAPDGGVYNVGYFADDADLDPGSGERRFEVDDDDGDTDLFVSRFVSNGDLVWVGPIAGDGLELVASADTDVNGDLVISGSYFGKVDLDPTSRRVIRETQDAGNREDSNEGDRDNAYAGFVAVIGKSNARLRRSAQVDGFDEEDVFITGATLAASGELRVAGRYRGGLSVAGTSFSVVTDRDYEDKREDAYALAFDDDLAPIV